MASILEIPQFMAVGDPIIFYHVSIYGYEVLPDG